MTFDYICGVMFGFELVDDEEDQMSYYVVDLGIVRIMFAKEWK